MSTTTANATTDPSTPREELLTIGGVSERTGLSVHALRYYERDGLIPSVIIRSTGGRRLYSSDDVAWFLMCNRFRAAGMPVADIRRYAELVAEGAGNEQERIDLLRVHQERVESEITNLQQSLTIISSKADRYQAHIDRGLDGEPWRDDPGCLVVEASLTTGRSQTARAGLM